MNIQGMNPLMAAPLQAQATSSSATTGTGSSSSTTDPNSASSLESTFLSLLVTELQNQDPTQPVDPTQMVSEMISLNQLDQLISINTTLSGLTGTSGATGQTSSQAASTAGALGSGSNANASALGAAPTPNPISKVGLFNPTTGAPGTVLHGSPITSRAASDTLQPLYSGAVSPAALTPAAWSNLYGNLGAPANGTNKFTAVGGR